MKKIFLPILILLVFEACRQTPDEVSSKAKAPSDTVTLTDAQFKAANIRMGKIGHKPMVSTIQVNGSLDVPPQNLITISAPMGGFVKNTKLLQGMKVSKGEVIATLQHQDYIQLQQDYLNNVSQLGYLEVEYNRQSELAKENINSQKTLQQAKSNYEIAKANVQGLEAKLAMINITASSLIKDGIKPTITLYAPLSGFVTEVNVNIGEFVMSTDVMFKIVNLEHLHAELQVYEKDIRKISAGQKVAFHLANESTPRTASVYLIGREISPDRTVRIHCHLDKEDENLLPGMYITASIETVTEEADVIPNSAIASYEGQHVVFVKSGRQQFKMIDIETGNVSGDFTAVQLTNVLHIDDSIVVQGAFELLGLLKNTEQEE
jgi:cobalt-zinc-cadmium efflux system membrane fusion protein